MNTLSPTLPRSKSEDAYLALKDLVIASTGLAYYIERDDEFSEKIGVRMTALKSPRATSIWRLCGTSPVAKRNYKR